MSERTSNETTAPVGPSGDVPSLVNPDQIENIVGAKRRTYTHLARAVSAEQTVYILHSQTCLDEHDDLRECRWSQLLDKGIDVQQWRGFEDRVVVPSWDGERIVPLDLAWFDRTFGPEGMPPMQGELFDIKEAADERR